jgi:hypothetical protein
VRAHPGSASAPGITRRQMITGLLLLPPALAGCSIGAGARKGPDPLIALADAARSDAALAAAALASAPALAARVQPLVEARTAHAQALDAEVARLDPQRPTQPPPAQAAARPARTTTLPEVRAAVLSSGQSAAAAALTLPADRVGLVASVAACCAAYAQVLG